MCFINFYVKYFNTVVIKKKVSRFKLGDRLKFVFSPDMILCG